jgi:hypothetical protein
MRLTPAHDLRSTRRFEFRKLLAQGYDQQSQRICNAKHEDSHFPITAGGARVA